MTNEQITKLCEKKELELLQKYFGNATVEAIIKKPERIDEYTMDLPLKIEAEYKLFLDGLWKEYAPEEIKDTPLLLEGQKLRKLKTDNDRDMIDIAHEDAIKRTLWERITKTNHKDVTFYKGLLEKYTCDLLTVMRHEFLEKISVH